MIKIKSILPILLFLAVSCGREDMYSHLSSEVGSHQKMTAITVSPTDSLISQGETRSFTASAVYSDGSTTDITASVQWSVSGNATLGINGSIIAGPVAGPVTVTASYNDFKDTAEVYVEPATSIFVSTASGNDSTISGSSNKPFKTINYAFEYAILNSKSKIFVAAGDYNITNKLTISQDIAIYGGYATDWSRNIQKNGTRINDTGISGGTLLNPVSPIIILSGNPELNGLYINGHTSPNPSAAMYITGGSPSIIACELDGGSGGNVFGLKIDNASVTIDSCIINGGTSGSPDTVYGLYLSTSSSFETLKLYNSIFHIQGGDTEAIAINLYAPSGSGITMYGYNCAFIIGAAPNSMTGLVLNGNITGNICNNTIIAHTINSKSSIGLSYSNINTTGLFFSNNIFDVSGNTFSRCLIFGSSTSAITLKNNLFYLINSSNPYFKRNSMDFLKNESVFFDPFTSSGNIIDKDPRFYSSSDFHPASDSPAIGAGINGSSWTNFPKSPSSSGPIDLDGASRPTSGAWTIGAFQNAKKP